MGEKLNNCSNPNETCLLDYVIPVHYHIKLNHVMETYDSYLVELLNLKDEHIFVFYGESHTTINILQSTQYIKLHMLNLIIYHEKTTLIKNNGINYALTINTETYKTNLLEFDSFNVLSPGLYTLKFKFFGRLTENSSKEFFKSFFINKENVIM